MADSFSQLIIKILGDSSPLDKEMKKSQRLLEQFSATTTSIGTKLTAGLSTPLIGIGAASLTMYGKLETAKVGFTTLMGSADLAQKHLTDLKQFAETTPFEFNGLLQSSQRLQALGWSAQQVIPTLRIIGDTAAGLGRGAEGIDRITLALSQMRSKGKAQSEEMQQLAEIGIPAWEMLAKTLRVDVATAQDMVQKRLVDGDVAVKALLDGMQGRFNGLSEAISKTLPGRLSNLQDKLFNVGTEIGQTLAPAAGRAIDKFAGLADGALDLVKGFSKLPEPIQDTTLALGGMAAAAGPVLVIVGQIAGAIREIRGMGPMLAGAGALASRAAVGALSVGGATVGAGLAGAYFLREEANKQELGQAVNSSGFGGMTELILGAAKAREKQAAAAKAAAGETHNLGEVTKMTTLASLAELEVQSRKEAGWKTVANAYADLWTYQLKVTTSTYDLVAASDSYSQGLLYQQSLLKGVANETKMVEIATGAYKTGIFEVESIMESLGKKGPMALLQIENATRANLDRMLDLQVEGKATAAQVDVVRQAYIDAYNARTGGVDNFGNSAKRAKQPLLQVSTITTDLSRGIVDVAFQGGKFGTMMSKIAVDTGKAISRNLVEGGFNQMSKSIGKLISKELPGLSSALKKVFDFDIGGKSTGIIKNAAGGTPSIPTGGTGGTGGASSGLGSAVGGITGALTAVGSIGSMVSGIIGNFQMAGMGKDLGRMEESLRGILNVLALNGSESIHSFAKQSMYANIGVRDYWTSTGHTLLVKMTGALESMAGGGMKAAGAGTVNIYIDGSFERELESPAFKTKLLDTLGRHLKFTSGIR